MQDHRPYWNMEIEPRLNMPEIKEMQWAKLRKKIDNLYNGTSFWRSRLDDNGVKPGQIKTWEDFERRIPLFTKEEYRQYSEECDGDMDRILEGLLGQDAKRLVFISTTSGTTGAPTPYPFTKGDMDLWAEYCKRMLWRCGVFPGDRLLHAFGLSMHIAGIPQVIGFSEYGVCVIPVGAEAGSEAILKFAKLFKPKAMACTPSLAEYIIEKARVSVEEGVDSMNISVLLCGGEPGAGIPEVRSKIENTFNAKLFDIGGGGCSCDYPEYQGMHFFIDDYLYFELVDPATHEHVPLEDGATGLIAHTQIGGSTTLAGLRQTTNDIMQVYTSPCPCGRTGFRYKIIGRADDMLKVKGVMVYPPAIEGVINSFAPRVTGEFRIVLDEPLPRVVPPLKLRVEYGEGVQEIELAGLEKELAEAMHARVKIRPEIIWTAPNTLERFLKKKKIFEKTYEKEG